MNLRRISARVAVAGATTALAAGALVGATGVAANAATVTNTYTCSLPNVYSGDFDLTVTGEIPVPQYWAGADVPPNLINVTASATVPADAAGLLGAAGVTGAKASDFAFALGSGSVPVPLEGDFQTSGGTTTWEATGSNTAFTTPNPGSYDAVMPSAFTMTTQQGDTDSVSLGCALKEGTTPQAITEGFVLLQQSSAMTAPKSATAKASKTAKVTVNLKSSSLGTAIKGAKVVAKEGSKTLGSAKTDKKGNATISLGKLKAGKHKVTFSYAGTKSMKASSAKTTVTSTK